MLVRDDLDALRRTWDRDAIAEGPLSIWRYAPALPVRARKHIVSLGEGLTPLHRLDRLGSALEFDNLWLKDEGRNPTGSFKAPHVFMPRDAPVANVLETRAFGAHVTLVDGLISDCAKRVADGVSSQNWFDVSTRKEPYRIEGKKTMGYEAAEQFNWSCRTPSSIRPAAASG